MSKNEEIQKTVKPEPENEVSFKIEGRSYKPYLFVFLTILATLIQVLSSRGNTDSTFIVTLYFSIVLLTIGIYKIGFYGVISALLSSLIFTLTIKQSWQNVLIAVGANTIQALIIFLIFKFYKFKVDENKNTIPVFKIAILFLGLVYVVYNLIFGEYYIISSSILLGLLALLFIIRFIRTKDASLLAYLGLIAIIPNLVGGATGSLSYNEGFVFDNYFNDSLTWFFSNSILLLSFGYVLFDYIKNKLANVTFVVEGKSLNIYLSTLLFYISTILWNVIFYVLYYLGWLNKNLTTYIFPWFVGILFFIANLFLSLKKEITGNNEDSFKWYEGRAIVAENNTQMLVAIIALLLPLCAQFMGTITQSISVLFILNITSAIVSIGLIWIPKGMTKYMSTVKHLKTIFHLYTVCLLLLNIVLIINEAV